MMQLNARVQSIASHAHANALHVLWPIRTPTLRLRQSKTTRPTCANQGDLAFVTPRRPTANSVYTAVRHV